MRATPPPQLFRGISVGNWLPIAVFVLYAAINMLDRQLLAAVAPALRRDFGLTNAQYGALLSVFFAISAISSPLAGWFIDRVGVNWGASVAIVFWSISGTLTGFTQGLRSLMACRVGLGLGEAGGNAIPGAVLARYMDPAQLGIGAAMLASGASLGSISAPLVAAALAPAHGWRSVFIVSGGLGLLWVPLWLVTAKVVPPRFEPTHRKYVSIRDLLRDRRFLNLTAAYALSKQTLWFSWTTLYFVQERGLTMAEANQSFSWYPSAFGAAGAFVAGALAMYRIRRGVSALEARLSACWKMAPLLVLTAAVPLIPWPALAAIAIGLSFFASASVWTSVHVMPIDLYGVERSAFAFAVLEGVSLMIQTVTSPVIGEMVDNFGFTPVCLLMPLFPIGALLTLRFGLGARTVLHAN